MRRVILIGGAPTAGKSHAARELSKTLGLPWISTDGIREMMRKIVRPEDMPELFHHSDPATTAEQFLNSRTAEEIVRSQNGESEEVWKGVRALIETDYVWESFIVEGVAVLPHLVHASFPDDPEIRPVFLISENKDRIRKIVFERGLWDEADKYPDSVKEKEVEWAHAFSVWLKAEAEQYGYPTFSVDGEIDINDLAKIVE